MRTISFFILILLNSCSSFHPIERRIASTTTSCAQLVLSISNHQNSTSLEDADTIIVRLKEALGDKSLPLEISDHFASGSRGENTLRYFREHQLELPKDWSEFNLSPESLENSFKKPEVINSDAIQAEDRIVIYQKDIYSNSYFAKMSNIDTSKRDADYWKKLFTAQPWFKWNQKNGKFELKMEGATSSLIEKAFAVSGPLNKKLKIYRGTFKGEYHLLKLLQLLGQNELLLAQKEAADTIKFMAASDFSKILEKFTKETSVDKAKLWRNEITKNYFLNLKKSKFGELLFTTDNSKKAGTFSKGAVLEFEVSKDQLNNLVKTDGLYAGIEYDIELAFKNEDAILSLADSLKDMKEELPDGTIFSSDSKHVIWGKN